MEFVGHSRAIARLRAQIVKIARSHASVFIVGESGAGKEIAANEIHTLRAGRSLRCSQLRQFCHRLAESDLFGLERRAFTSATAAGPVITGLCFQFRSVGWEIPRDCITRTHVL